MFANHGIPRPAYGRIFVVMLIFVAAYLASIRVHAQETMVQGSDAIQLGTNSEAAVTGVIKQAEDNFMVIDVAGKDIKVVLDKIDLKADTDTLFQPGMSVTVNGKMKGDDFGTPLMEAHTVTMSENPAVIYYGAKPVVP